MKRIITSLGMIVFAAAIVASGTGAFFSDTETSTGNVFTAGAIDLTVDSEAHYNGMICVPNTSTEGDTTDYWWQPEVGTVAPFYPAKDSACVGTWAATNLGAQTFFSYADVKPGDEGENTISLHVNNNPAWACVDVNITKNDDNGFSEPEDAVAGANNDSNDGTPTGDLAENLKFAAWLDQGSQAGWQGKGQDAGEGDNIWGGPQAEPLLFSNQSGPASDVLGGKSYALAAPNINGGTPMAPNVTNYIGLAWCAGTQTISGNTITCDGASMGNIAQTDTLEASIAFRVEQSRNNENFRCTPEVAPVVTKLTLAKTVTPAEVVPDSAFTLTATGPSVISGIEGASAVTNATILPGVYTLTESAAGPGGEVLTWSCTGNATPEVGNTVTIAAGEIVTCEATNLYPQAG